MVFRMQLLLGHVVLIFGTIVDKKMVVFSHYMETRKLITQCIFNLMHTLTGVQHCLIFVPHWPNFGPLFAQICWKYFFPSIILKTDLSIYFDFGICTCMVSVQNRSACRPCWPNFGPYSCQKLQKMLVSNHYWKKNLSLRRFQISCIN